MLSEGAVVLVLETLAHARARDAELLAELRSYGATSDGAHQTAPDPHGTGALECMRRALRKAQLSSADVDYVSAHAPGTPLGDSVEASALRTLLGERTERVPVSAIKSTTGHLLGGAGALAVAVTACALREGRLPPTINLSAPDPSCDLLPVAHQAQGTEAHVALVSAYGFGGHNRCIVMTPAP